MASYTPNINLKKPTTSEYYNVLDENSNKDKIDTAIGTLNSQLTLTSVTLGSFTSTVTNAWELTGLTITVPSGHVYIGNLQQSYGNGRPLGLAINDSDSLGLAGIPLRSAYDSNGLYSTFVLLTSGTWYVFTKRAGTGSNYYYFSYFDLKS